MRKVLKNFESLSQPAELVRKPNQQFIGFSFPEWQFGSLAPFMSVLSHSVSELYTVCFFFFGFLTL